MLGLLELIMKSFLLLVKKFLDASNVNKEALLVFREIELQQALISRLVVLLSQ